MTPVTPTPSPKDKTITDLTAALTQAAAKLKEQDEILKQMAELPGLTARVTHLLKDDLILLDGHIIMETPKKLKGKLKVGTWLHVSKSPMGGVGIIDTVEVPETPAIVMTVAMVTKDMATNTVRVFLDGGPGHLLPVQELSPTLGKVEVGDRLVLGGSPGASIALENLGKETKRFQLSDDLGVSWDDIGGLSEAKLAMREAIEYPSLYAHLYKALGKRPIKGVLLEGPPGCGKTMLAKAAAVALAKTYGKTAQQSGYIYVKGPEVLSKWVGEAESTIRMLFQMAREHKSAHGYPAIIFIDEAEALLSKRGMGVSSDMEKTIVPSFLAELDGLGDSGSLCLLATNRSERLDPAIVRDGRIDRRVRVKRPNREATTEIFEIHLSKIPACRTEKVFKPLADYAAKQVFSPERIIARVDIGLEDHLLFDLGHCISGAMVAGIVDKATSIALHKAIADGDHKNLSIGEDHISKAVSQTHSEMKSIDHTDDIATLAQLLGGKVRSTTLV